MHFMAWHARTRPQKRQMDIGSSDRLYGEASEKDPSAGQLQRNSAPCGESMLLWADTK